MPADKNLLKYLEELSGSTQEDVKEEEQEQKQQEHIDLFPEIPVVEDRLEKVKKIKLNIKKPKKPVELETDPADIEELVKEPEESKEVNKENKKSDIDEFLERARQEAAKKEHIQEQRDVSYDVSEEEVSDVNTIEEEEEHKEVSIAELMEQAETSYQDEWIEMYESGIKSKKNNEIVSKMRSGRFRINSDHQVEILSDKNTYGKSADDLLNEHWN